MTTSYLATTTTHATGFPLSMVVTLALISLVAIAGAWYLMDDEPPRSRLGQRFFGRHLPPTPIDSDESDPDTTS